MAVIQERLGDRERLRSASRAEGLTGSAARERRATSGRLRIVGWIIGAVLCLSLGLGSLAEAAFARRKLLTVQAGQVAGGSQTNYPLLVNVTHNDLKSTAHGGFVTSSEGYDIVFRGENDTICGGVGTSPCLLDHEIEVYGPATGSVVAWVRVPSIADGAQLYLYYGDLTVTCSQENAAGVWQNGYREVFHLDEAADYADSTTNAYTAVTRGTVNQAVTQAAAGRAADFVGAGNTESRLIASDGYWPANLTLPGTNSFTIEAWFRFDAMQTGDFTAIATKGRDGTPNVPALSPPDWSWVGLFKNGADRLSFGWACCDGPPYPANNLLPGNLNSATVMTTGTWYYGAATYDGSTGAYALFLNGAPEASDDRNAVHRNLPQYLRIGDDSNGFFHDGQIDEVRVSTTVRSASWILTTWRNINAPGTFLSMADANPPPAVSGTCAAVAVDPCLGGPGTCNLRSIGPALDYGTAGPNGAGTQVLATTGSAFVAGVGGTQWTSFNRNTGDLVTINGVPYTIKSTLSETEIELTSPFGEANGTYNYAIARKFPSPSTWAACVTGGACPGASSSSLVADNRSEIGVIYDDGSAYTPPVAGSSILEINGSTTDAAHTITLTADPGNRHLGVRGAGVILDNTGNSTHAVLIQDQFVTLEWLEVLGGTDNGDFGIDYRPSAGANHFVARNNLVYDVTGIGIRLSEGFPVTADVVNNMVFRNGRAGIAITGGPKVGSRIRILNNTLFDNAGGANVEVEITNDAGGTHPWALLRNNIMVDDSQAPDFPDEPWFNVGSSNNLSGDAQPARFFSPVPPPCTDPNCFVPDTGHSPRGGPVFGASQASLAFVATGAGAENLHIQAGSTALQAGADLSDLYLTDIDATARYAPWDIGADELGATVNYRSIGTAPDRSTVGGDGTVNVQSGSRRVVGSGTQWRSWNRGQGDVITIPAGGTPYVVFSVESNNELILTTPFVGVTASGLTYTMARQFRGAGAGGQALIDWENCVDGGPCTYFPAASPSLVADDRAEVGIVYADSVFILAANLVIDGSTTDAGHTIRLTANSANRHDGTPGAGVVLDGNLGSGHVNIQDGNVTMEWLELKGQRGTNNSALIRVVDAESTNVLLQNLLLHDYYDPAVGINQAGIRLSGTPGKSVTVRNVMVWDGDNEGIRADEPGDTLVVENCSIDDMRDTTGNPRRGVFADVQTGVIVRNTIATRSGTDFDAGAGSFAAGPTSTNNISSDGTAPGANPQTVPPASIGTLYVVPGSDLHLIAGAVAIDTGASLAARFLVDVDGSLRQAAWDIGADEFGVTTEVELQSFAAVPLDSAIELEWSTASELDNLGFHLYRSLSEAGPWDRITPSLIPGLGSSPTGATYAWREAGLMNGTRYFYRLEDVDTASVSTFHGPVSAVPQAGSPGPGEDPGDGGGSDPGDGSDSGGSDGSDTEPVPSTVYPACTSPPTDLPCVERYGDPESMSVREVRRRRRYAILELRTGGFEVVREGDGRVWVRVPGFEDPEDPHAPALPWKRVMVQAPVGKSARVSWVRERGALSFTGVVPSAAGFREMEVRADGTVRAGRRAARGRGSRGVLPRQAVRLGEAVFVGESKELPVSLFPVRYDARAGAVRLAQRIRVRVEFVGREVLESGSGTRGRRLPRRRAGSGETLAFLRTSGPGLYGMSFEELFPGRRRGIGLDLLSVAHQGAAVPYHVEPGGAEFKPGSVLYVYSPQGPSSTSYGGEVVFEVLRSSGGKRMGKVNASPYGDAITTPSLAPARFETNRIYQSGLLEAADLWLWENLVGGATKTKSFTLAGVDSTSIRPGRLKVHLQGGSDAEGVVDHHVEVFLNGVFVGETVFSEKVSHGFEVEVPANIFREGSNDFSVRNVGDTGVYSLVFLDRFSVEYPQASRVRNGVFEGEWNEEGIAQIALSGGGGGAGLLPTSPVSSSTTRRGARGLVGTLSGLLALDVTNGANPKWLVGVEPWGSGAVRLRAEKDRHYLLLTPEGVKTPVVSAPVATGLKSAQNHADYVVITPQAFVAAAQTLAQRREGQGLRTKVATLEEITSAFGHGEASGEAIRSFLSWAYHEWTRPSPRYVVLLGDASHDPRNFIGTSGPAPLPALFLKTSYLVTASDPTLVAVNGEDLLPDLSIGRLPAQTVEQAQGLVEKLIAWEESGQGLGGKALLVADNPDEAGDFEWDVHDIEASFLSDRETETILVRQEGAGTRSKILAALDGGTSTVSYAGHGGAAVWASENVLNSWDVASLQEQSTQGVMLTLNCLNGYFVAPSFDSLGEAYLKAEGRGTIAAFSPSGLSLDGPAHQFHRALMRELVSGIHERLGDAVLAAQESYAHSGLMPELLSVYHLLGDPGMKIRP